MKENKLCPVCGSARLERIVQKETINGDMGKELTVDIPHVRCNECGSEGDFYNENEEVIEKAITNLNTACINDALNFFNERNISFAGIERAVGLPQRTLTKWKNGISSPTAAGIALLKYLRIFPWLIDVAEHKFDFNVSQKIFMGTALNMFINSMSLNNADKSGYSATAGNNYTNFFSDNIYLTQENTFNISFVQQGS